MYEFPLGKMQLISLSYQAEKHNIISLDCTRVIKLTASQTHTFFITYLNIGTYFHRRPARVNKLNYTLLLAGNKLPGTSASSTPRCCGVTLPFLQEMEQYMLEVGNEFFEEILEIQRMSFTSSPASL